MSKSLGNTIVPQQVIKDNGADVLRLWVSMVDYRDELRLGKAVLARTIEAYRKIRNTFRYLMSNLYDFDPARDAVEGTRMLDVDRFALATYAKLAGEATRAYEDYDFQAVFHAINEFVTVDLSAFFVDVSKDRLYTFRADSIERRSAQTVQYVIADGLARLLAPILSMTADEVWASLPGPREESIHLTEFPRGVDVWRDEIRERDWTELRALRATVNGQLELARAAKTIGSSLEAHVRLHVPPGHPLDALVRGHLADLPMLFIVSSVDVVAGADDLRIDVAHASGDKCPRCWRFVPEQIASGDLEGLCLRCAEAIGDTVASAS